jgi:hypothetical protein
VRILKWRYAIINFLKNKKYLLTFKPIFLFRKTGDVRVMKCGKTAYRQNGIKKDFFSEMTWDSSKK